MADQRIHYGPAAEQFGDLWLPKPLQAGRSPLVVMLHGGWWKSAYSLDHVGFLCEALRGAGIAAWSLEYRRVGVTGGGWPVTFEDAAKGFDFVESLAMRHPVDASRVVTMGHSAGGHLAFWLAGRHHVPAGSPIEEPRPRVAIKAAIALAGAVDLQLTIDLAHGGFAHNRGEVERLMGGSPEAVPERYLAGDPGRLLPLGVPQFLVQGTADDEIPPELPQRWAAKARVQGDAVSLRMLPKIEHMDVVDPASGAWPVVLETVKHALAG